MSDASEIADITERIKERDALEQSVPQRLREAVKVLGGLLAGLPGTDVYLLMPQAVEAWQALRDEDPDSYLVHLGLVRQRCGRHISDLIGSRIGAPAAHGTRELRLLTVPELRREAPVRELVPGIPADGFGTIIGESGSGKSFFADSFLLAGATGAKWFDWKVPHAGAIILGLEGRRPLRMQAHQEHHGLTDDDLALVRVLETPIDLCGRTADLERLLPLVGRARSEIGMPCNVLVDTHARAMAGGEENGAADTGATVDSYARIREVAGGCLLVTHHTGKDPARGGRGSTALRAAADFELLIERQPSGVRTATFTKTRDSEDGRAFAFRLEQCAGSCVLVPCADVPAPKPVERRLGLDEAIARDTLKEAIAANGETLAGTSEIPGGRRGVKVDTWRSRFYAKLGETRDASSDATRKAWQRGMKGLIAKKIAGVGGQHAWLW